MFNDVKAGDTVLRRMEVRLYSEGWSTINVNVAVPHVVERVTATRIVIDGRQYLKENGREHGGKGLLLKLVDGEDKNGQTYDTMTWDQIATFKDDFVRFDKAFRHVHPNRRITQYCVYRAFKNTSLRQGILLREEQFRNAVKEALEAYNVEIEIGR